MSELVERILLEMKKISVLLLIAASASMMLFGCGKKAEVPEETVNGADIGLSTSKKEEPATEAETESPEEENNEGKVRSQLTNEWVDEALENQRPIAVMTPNDTSALPHYSISKAGVLYEMMVEGSITRLMQIIDDWKDLERIGNVRSARHYFVFAAFEWDPIFCHYGNPYYADFVLDRPETDNINGLVAPAGVFFRTSDRKAPQNAYLSGEGIVKGAESYKYSLEHTDKYQPNHYTFAPEKTPNTLEDADGVKDAKKIDMAKAYPVSKTYFEYNEEDGLYYRFQYGKPHVDAVNDEQLSFKNIIVQNTYYETLDAKGYLNFQMHDTKRDGYFFTNGKGIHVTWEKTSDFGPTKYYDDDGNEVVFNTGKTMVCVVQDGKEFSYN